MARPDFAKKWASSRPSIPEIASPDYAQGFATYLGAIPPSTDDHDYIMNLQDERAVWLANSQLDSVRVNVASASTVNLITAAPDTRHINITGTTTITAFTVEDGQTYFVRFAGALTLTNNAGIATQSGANIKTAAGDTCIIRATAANVVELVSYATAKNQSLGYVQTWQDLTASRAAGTTYTNTTGKPIAVMVGGNSAGAGGTFNLQTVVEGLTIQAHLSDYQSITSFIVPQGSTYQVTTTGSLSKWSELR